jgi:hypothetical protein
MVTPPDSSSEPTLVKDWRFYSGMAALVLALILPFGAFVLPMLGLSAATTTVLAGVMVAGGSEVLCIMSAALMGKKTFQYISHRVKVAFLEQPASKARYYICLVVVTLSWIPLYIYAYFPSALPARPVRIYFLISMDLAFVFGVFLMGPEFWEKVRRIFIYEGAA